MSNPRQAQSYPELLPVPPRPGEIPGQIVRGFLAASASFANNYQIAREYLTKGLHWQPQQGATIINNNVKVKSARVPPGNSRGTTATVVLTASHRATLTSSGQYVQRVGPKPYVYSLVLQGSVWRISRLPSQLILQRDDFERTYLARNLYFYSPVSPSGTGSEAGTAGQHDQSELHRLVPDPIYVQLTGTNAASLQQPALDMVKDLRAPPSAGPLAGSGVSTAFPVGVSVLGVHVFGTQASVDLGGAAATASQQQLSEMAAQIVWTLTDSSYAPSPINSVELQVKHVTRRRVLVGRDFADVAPPRPAGDLYYLAKDRVWRFDDGQPQQQPWLTGAESPQVTQIAVQPGGAQIAGLLPQQRGCRVYIAPPTRKAAVQPSQLGGKCSSLSFDSLGNLWVAAGSSSWELPQGSRTALPVMVSLPSQGSVLALRVAPDGSRVAALVRNSHGQAQLWLGAIQNGQADERPGPPRIFIGRVQGSMLQIGTDVPDPQSLAWYDSDHLVVLSGGGGSQLFEVPVNGGSSTEINVPGGAVSVAATRPGQQQGKAPALAIANAAGEIQLSNGTTATGAATWTKIKGIPPGTAPVFPG